MVDLFANSGYPDHMFCSVCLHTLPVTGLGVSSLQWVREYIHCIKTSRRIVKGPHKSEKKKSVC